MGTNEQIPTVAYRLDQTINYLNSVLVHYLSVFCPYSAVSIVSTFTFPHLVFSCYMLGWVE